MRFYVKPAQDELHVIDANDFDLCMSWADRLIDAGEYDRAIDLIKAATHKYLRRYPSGKATPRWYYVYKITSKHVGQPVQEGEKIKLTHEGQTGHYEVEKVHPNGYATVRHDETGHRMSVKTDYLHEMFTEEHKGAIDEAHARLKQTFEAAKKYGSESQRERAREALKGHEDRFSIKTPEHIAGTRALSLTVLTHTEPSVENHQAAADAHQQAADLGAPQADLHRQLAEQHRIAAKSRIALQASAAALKDPEDRFHVPAEDANKASTPVIVLPKQGGQRKASGAFFGSKEQAYHSIIAATETNGAFLDQFHRADKAYRMWKAGQGPKPPSWGGGELDHLNQALSLDKPLRVIGKQPKDPTLTSPAEAWDRLVKGAKRWDSQTTRHALQVFHEWFADHGINFRLPDEAEAAINARHLAEQEAQYADDMGGEHQAAVIHDHMQEAAENDASFDPDKIESELDTSFDFGFNVQAEDADPREEYQKSGTKAKTFKGWFGDWESDPHNASKAVNAKGEPAEQHNMAPMPVYHGTAVGGFTAFDPEKTGSYNIFGEGFYFTEDKGIAEEYTKKDNDEAKWGAMHGLTDASGKEVTHLSAKWAQKVIASTPGFGGEPGEYADWDAQCVAAALKRAMEPRGVNVAKFLQEYRAPSGPVLDSKGEPDKYSHHGSPLGLRSFVKRLSKEKVGDYKPAVIPPQVFECYLNVRKPIDMDKPLTREDFRDLAGYMNETEKDKYRPKYLGDKKPGPEKWAHADTVPFYTKNLNDHPDVRAMGDDAFSKAFTYDDFLKAKGHLRKEIGEKGAPAYPIFHLSDEKTLTWGDVHYIMSDGHNYQTAKQLFKAWAQQRGYDGISHTGGWNVGTHAHRVWIAWTPNQIKAVGNEGTFNATTSDIYKAMRPENQPHIFVIIPDDDVLGVPTTDLSFKGRLGIAFGARGDKDAPIAHYEPDKFVINITKYRGGGSLAHEWAHGLDNVISFQHRPKGNTTLHLSDVPDASFLPEHIRHAYGKLHEAMSLHPDPEKAKAAHEKHTLELRDKDRTLTHDYNTLVAKVQKLRAKVRPEISEGQIKQTELRISAWREELADAEKRFASREATRKKLKREPPGYMKAYSDVESRKRWIADAEKKIADIRSGERVRKPEDEAEAMRIAGDAEMLRSEINQLRDQIREHHKMDPTISNWKRGSHLLGEYFATPTEMFARAFECYVADELEKQGRKNTYLVSRARTIYNFPTGKMLPDGSEAQPYPQGKERARIVDAMETFLRQINESGDLRKALAGLLPLQRFTIQADMSA